MLSFPERVGPYACVGLVGRGATGLVVRARNADREVALKLLRPSAQVEAVARFLREGRLLASLGEAEGFVPILDVLDEPPCIVMPYFADGTLRDRLKRGRLGIDEAIAVVRTLAYTLGRAHERGIVHRDLKPENVLFSGKQPLVADLGLAKHFRTSDDGSVSISAHGAFRGTLGYAAPEQLRDAKSVGPPADVFALGAILFECIAGRAPYDGDSAMAMIERASAGDHEALGTLREGVPAWLESAVDRALAPNAWDRFPDAGAFARALAPPETAGARSHGALSAVTLGATATALVLLGATCALLVTSSRRPVTSAPGPSPATSALASPAAGSSPPVAARLVSSEVRAEAEAHFRRALTVVGRAEARAELDRAIELDRDYALAWAQRADSRNAASDWTGAEADATRALQLAPTLALAWSSRALARGHLAKLDAALADANRSLELDGGQEFLWRTRAWVKLMLQDADGAIADATRGIEINAGAFGSWHVRAQARNLKGEHAFAILDYTRAIELDATVAEDFAGRGTAYGITGNYAKSLPDWDRALSLEPENVGYLLARCTARARSGNNAGALEDASHAVRIDPTNVTGWNNRAIVHQRQGELAGALADFERALALAPEGPQAPTFRTEIGRLKAQLGAH